MFRHSGDRKRRLIKEQNLLYTKIKDSKDAGEIKKLTEDCIRIQLQIQEDHNSRTTAEKMVAHRIKIDREGSVPDSFDKMDWLKKCDRMPPGNSWSRDVIDGAYKAAGGPARMGAPAKALDTKPLKF